MRLKKILPLLVASLFMAGSSSEANQANEQRYESPDGRHVAHVITVAKAQYGAGESEVIIKTANGATLCAKNYGSETGKHGFSVHHAAWTPNSRFFVYSMSSSGGHQPWHFPTDFISIPDGKIRSLGEYLGPITKPVFKLSAPDRITINSQSKNTLEEVKSEVGLDSLLRK